MAADGDITKDGLYDAVAADDFQAMLDTDRYGDRSTAFDRIISATHDHFWDPLDPRYIDFSQPFDMATRMLVPEWMVIAMGTDYVSDHLADPAIRVAFVNQSVRRSFSTILHGEQGALALSASLCHVLKDQGAQEYAANQAREEARHVTAFARYIKVRWGSPTPCGPALQGLLTEIVAAPEVYKKIVGMQILVEGLAMGAFAIFHNQLADPVGRRLMQLVMTDEAFHHRFGKIWADRTIPRLSPDEHAVVEDWAARCFLTLLANLLAPSQQPDLYAAFGMDPAIVAAEVARLSTDDQRRRSMAHDDNIFRVLTKTLLNAGIVTARTRHIYARYVDLDALGAEGERMIGDDIAEAGVAYLKEINAKDRNRAPAAPQ
ncbi:MAG: integral rane protein [Caulobacteraceae bacterium]|nr:integral rane protein [Caulobacteraceae bacterium]